MFETLSINIDLFVNWHTLFYYLFCFITILVSIFF